MSKIFVFSGASGVGKSSALKRVMAERNDLRFSVSATTRQPRIGERDGVDYHFISPDVFSDWIEKGEFLEYAEYVSNFYGTPKRYVDEAMSEGKDVILDIEIQGAQQVHVQRPDVVRIFIAPPSWEELERRLIGRGTESPEKVRSRLARGKVEFAAAKDFDYFVINETVEQAVAEIRAIICAEHCRPDERLAMIN